MTVMSRNRLRKERRSQSSSPRQRGHQRKKTSPMTRMTRRTKMITSRRRMMTYLGTMGTTMMMTGMRLVTSIDLNL